MPHGHGVAGREDDKPALWLNRGTEREEEARGRGDHGSNPRSVSFFCSSIPFSLQLLPSIYSDASIPPDHARLAQGPRSKAHGDQAQTPNMYGRYNMSFHFIWFSYSHDISYPMNQKRPQITVYKYSLHSIL